jgi:hypothetical protein
MITMPAASLAGPAGITALLADLLSSDPQPAEEPHLTYLRRKAGRGLVAVYGSASDPDHLYTVTVDESACSAAALQRPDETAPREWVGQWPGRVEQPSAGLAVQAFPTDRGMPGLTASMTPSQDRTVWQALEAAGRQVLGDQASWELTSADPEPIRYKPGDRCVIRYRLRFSRELPGGGHSEETATSVIGKLYQHSHQATDAYALMARLALGQPERPWIARPLAVLQTIPLVLSEDLGAARDATATVAGTDVIRAANQRSDEAIRLAAHALAQLHTSGVAAEDTTVRTGPDEATKAAKRAGVLREYAPHLAALTDQVSVALCKRLTALPTDAPRPAHGSYKPSQLLFRAGSVFIVDFDQFCLADPALDVGYFLAYLRPPGLWYGRAVTRSWFQNAAATFLSAYCEALAERGVSESTYSEIVSRSAVYQAALLLKIAARRANRMHSPRPAEIEAILTEIGACLATVERS